MVVGRRVGAGAAAGVESAVDAAAADSGGVCTVGRGPVIVR
jgi:hypothetical protein